MKKVCVSFKELYKENGSKLHYGGYIDFYDEDGEREYYDFRNYDPDMKGSELIACDGEQFNVVNECEEIIVLEHTDTERKLYLTRDEYNIAVFE